MTKETAPIKLTRMEFVNTGEEFSGYDAAVKWLESQGYSVGSMQARSPTGFVKGNCVVSKWRSLSEVDKFDLDGQIEAGDFRHGTVVVSFK
jgi:hypothetical protein